MIFLLDKTQLFVCRIDAKTLLLFIKKSSYKKFLVTELTGCAKVSGPNVCLVFIHPEIF
jgi:hypothetical protein